MSSTPIILVPGFWLGAWAWHEVAEALRADGHDVTALTLPGLESVDADRSSITLDDHVEAICDAVRAPGVPVVLAVHSGAGVPGYAATDRVPDLDRAHGLRRHRPGDRRDGSRLRGRRVPPAVARGARREREPRRAQRRAARHVPQPGRARAGRRAARHARAHERRAPRRAEHADRDGVHVAGIPRRRRRGPALARRPQRAAQVTYVDLPTSHWPMWSKPKELADIIGGIAKAHPSQA